MTTLLESLKIAAFVECFVGSSTGARNLLQQFVDSERFSSVWDSSLLSGQEGQPPYGTVTWKAPSGRQQTFQHIYVERRTEIVCFWPRRSRVVLFYLEAGQKAVGDFAIECLLLQAFHDFLRGTLKLPSTLSYIGLMQTSTAVTDRQN